MNLIQQIEAEEIGKVTKEIPEFQAGDTVRVGVKVIEGMRERIQNFEGVCIAVTPRHGQQLHSPQNLLWRQ